MPPSLEHHSLSWHHLDYSVFLSPVRPAWMAVPCALTLGNFDGFHRGHQLLIAKTQEAAKILGVASTLLSFNPHPASFFNPSKPLFRLTPPDIQERLAAKFGLDRLLHLQFNAALANLPAEDFVETILLGGLSAKALIIGDDFHFGHRRSGTPERLQAWTAKRGVTTHIVPRLMEGNAPISSSAIRAYLSAGDIASANNLLGYRFFVSGIVTHGQKLGRTLGFPTANLAFDAGFALKYGIYAVTARVDDTNYQAVASFGRRPTFDDGAPLLETYLFDFSGDLYDKRLDITFHAYLRPELKFASTDALIAQMQQDCLEAKNALKTSA